MPAGFLVETVDNGEKAIGIIEKDDSFDLVILDCKMPGIDGRLVKTEIRKMNSKIPVIFLTGSLGETEKLDKSEVLLKPIDLHILLERINGLIGPR